jgi:hypothetical protein
MAKSSSTSKVGRARKGGSYKGTRSSRHKLKANHAKRDSNDANPFEDFGGERIGLMKAESILHCLSFALSYSSWSTAEGTTYGMAVDVARDLVQQSMDRLEQRDRHIESGKRRPS